MGAFAKPESGRVMGPPQNQEGRQRLRRRLDAYMLKKRLRSTNQRRLIVDTFFGGDPHISIEELLAEVRKRDSKIGYATVYRTLKLLTECGVASERRFGDGASRYELADDASAHHDHLICVTCDAIVEFEEPRIEELQEEVAAQHGFKLTTHRLEMYGVCLRGVKGDCPQLLQRRAAQS
jgi:Fur family transcriptional regulator, ferric uptake regulator